MRLGNRMAMVFRRTLFVLLVCLSYPGFTAPAIARSRTGTKDTGSTSFFRIVPEFDDFGTTMVCSTTARNVKLVNTAPVSSGIDVHVEAPRDRRDIASSFVVTYFIPQTLKPGDEIDMEIIFLPRIEGRVHETIVVETSDGIFPFEMSGIGVPNPYGLVPMIGLHVPVGQILDPSVTLFNPSFDHKLHISEVFTTEAFLHLSLPRRVKRSGSTAPTTLPHSSSNSSLQTMSPKAWTIEPRQEKELVRLAFKSHSSGKFLGYMHIKSDIANFLVPVEITVLVDILNPLPETLDFGTLQANEERTLNVDIWNTGSLPLSLVDFKTEPHDPRVTVRATHSTSSAAALPAQTESSNVLAVTYSGFTDEELNDADSLEKHSIHVKGVVVARTNRTRDNEKLILRVPFQAELLRGRLSCDDDEERNFVAAPIGGRFCDLDELLIDEEHRQLSESHESSLAGLKTAKIGSSSLALCSESVIRAASSAAHASGRAKQAEGTTLPLVVRSPIFRNEFRVPIALLRVAVDNDERFNVSASVGAIARPGEAWPPIRVTFDAFARGRTLAENDVFDATLRIVSNLTVHKIPLRVFHGRLLVRIVNDSNDDTFIDSTCEIEDLCERSAEHFPTLDFGSIPHLETRRQSFVVSNENPVALYIEAVVSRREDISVRLGRWTNADGDRINPLRSRCGYLLRKSPGQRRKAFNRRKTIHCDARSKASLIALQPGDSVEFDVDLFISEGSAFGASGSPDTIVLRSQYQDLPIGVRVNVIAGSVSIVPSTLTLDIDVPYFADRETTSSMVPIYADSTFNSSVRVTHLHGYSTCRVNRSTTLLSPHSRTRVGSLIPQLPESVLPNCFRPKSPMETIHQLDLSREQLIALKIAAYNRCSEVWNAFLDSTDGTATLSGAVEMNTSMSTRLRSEVTLRLRPRDIVQTHVSFGAVDISATAEKWIWARNPLTVPVTLRILKLDTDNENKSAKSAFVVSTRRTDDDRRARSVVVPPGVRSKIAKIEFRPDPSGVPRERYRAYLYVENNMTHISRIEITGEHGVQDVQMFGVVNDDPDLWNESRGDDASPILLRANATCSASGACEGNYAASGLAVLMNVGSQAVEIVSVAFQSDARANDETFGAWFRSMLTLDVADSIEEGTFVVDSIQKISVANDAANVSVPIVLRPRGNDDLPTKEGLLLRIEAKNLCSLLSVPSTISMLVRLKSSKVFVKRVLLKDFRAEICSLRITTASGLTSSSIVMWIGFGATCALVSVGVIALIVSSSRDDSIASEPSTKKRARNRKKARRKTRTVHKIKRASFEKDTTTAAAVARKDRDLSLNPDASDDTLKKKDTGVPLVRETSVSNVVTSSVSTKTKEKFCDPTPNPAAASPLADTTLRTSSAADVANVAASKVESSDTTTTATESTLATEATALAKGGEKTQVSQSAFDAKTSKVERPRTLPSSPVSKTTMSDRVAPARPARVSLDSTMPWTSRTPKPAHFAIASERNHAWDGAPVSAREHSSGPPFVRASFGKLGRSKTVGRERILEPWELPGLASVASSKGGIDALLRRELTAGREGSRSVSMTGHSPARQLFRRSEELATAAAARYSSSPDDSTILGDIMSVFAGDESGKVSNRTNSVDDDEDAAFLKECVPPAISTETESTAPTTTDRFSHKRFFGADGFFSERDMIGGTPIGGESSSDEQEE